MTALLCGAPSGASHGFAESGVASRPDKVPHELPRIVLLMRHAEKPLGKNDYDLSPAGFQRARMLPALFTPRPGYESLPVPNALFASAESKHSNRPIETITPLAHALHLPINTEFEELDTAGVAKKIEGGAYGNQVVLVCWHHGELPNLARAFGIANAPRWHEDVFDQVWEITWKDGVPQMLVLHEMLMPGDSPQS